MNPDNSIRKPISWICSASIQIYTYAVIPKPIWTLKSTKSQNAIALDTNDQNQASSAMTFSSSCFHVHF